MTKERNLLYEQVYHLKKALEANDMVQSMAGPIRAQSTIEIRFPNSEAEQQLVIIEKQLDVGSDTSLLLTQSAYVWTLEINARYGIHSEVCIVLHFDP